MDPAIKFLLDYNKSKATNIIRNAQALVGGAVALIFAIIKLSNMSDPNIQIKLFSYHLQIKW